MKKWQGELLLVMAFALRGSALLFSKIAMERMSPFTLIGVRFMIAFVILAVLFYRQLRTITRKELWHSFLIGTLLFASMGFELMGLQTTPSSTTAFIEGTAMVMVPIFAAALHRTLPERYKVLSALLATAGIGFLTLEGTRIAFTSGEILVLGCTITFALSIILTDAVAKQDDPIRIGVMQLFFIGGFGLIAAFLVETPHLPATGMQWVAIFYLSILCSAIGFAIIPIAQSHTTAERASLLTTANPLAALVLGIVFLHEKLSVSGIIGILLILAAILYSNRGEVKAREQAEAAQAEVSKA